MSGSVVDLIDRPDRSIISEALVSEASKLVEIVELLEELLSLDHSSFGTESEASNALLDLRAKLSVQAEIVNRLRREELHFAFWGNDEEKALREAELWERVLASFSPSGERLEEEPASSSSSSSQETRRVARKSAPAVKPPTIPPSLKKDPKPSSSPTDKLWDRIDADEEKALKDLKDEELGRTGTSLRWRQLEKKDKELWCRSPDGYCTSSGEEVVSEWFKPREEPALPSSTSAEPGSTSNNTEEAS
mgnify:CR=1 FL=1